MPICERDPWRDQYFIGVACPPEVRVPTDDIDSWDWFPRWRWIYDKINIARSQGLACGSHDDMPNAFPVFSKPAINLKGMGLGSRIVRSAAEFEQARQPGHMWMTLLHGPHVSTDCAVENGRCKWLRHASGETWKDGMFRHWTVTEREDPELAAYLTQWVDQHMDGYTGMMNFETIGGKIIEAHLRFADQWVDLYGPGWLDALVRLYAENHWHLPHETRRTGYSVPLFASHGQVPPHPTDDQQSKIRAMPGVASLQITYYETRPGEAHPMPPGGFRLGIVNCWDLDAGFAARRALAACFTGCEVMLPE
jgi:hypothetical protein